MNGLNDIVGQDAKEAGRWFSRPNLLINPDFTNPVNQPGLTEYSNRCGYTIDMWYAWNASVHLEDNANGILILNDYTGAHQPFGIFQRMNRIVPEDTTVTLSALYKGDIDLFHWTLFTGVVASSDDWSIASHTYIIPAGTDLSKNYMPYIGTPAGKQCYVRAAKLEKGPDQTLAHKDNGIWVLNRTTRYEDELRRCQAYQFSVRPENWTGYIIVGKGLVTSETVALVDVNLPVSLRGNPKPIWSGDFVLSHSGGYGAGIKVTDIQFDGRSQNGVSLKVTTAGGLKVGNAVRMIGNRDNGSMLLLDANP